MHKVIGNEINKNALSSSYDERIQPTDLIETGA